MKESEVTSWIFLSIALGTEKSAISYKDIIMIADGINHAVPNHNEIQSSIKFLLNKGYITKSRNKYSLTEIGKKIFDQESTDQRPILEILKNLTKYVT